MCNKKGIKMPEVTYTITVDKEMFPFVPGSEVVVRDNATGNWKREIFLGCIRKYKNYPYVCSDNRFAECHKRSTHAHLIGTNHPADTPACAKCGKAMPDCACEQELAQEYEFKPFQQVLVRDEEKNEWVAAIFSHENKTLWYKYVYVCTSWIIWQYCIPFEGNEHLLGTTNKPQIKYNADLI